MSKYVKWYNEEHRHSRIGYYTPNDVHPCSHIGKKQNRDSVLADAYLRTSSRFEKGTPSAYSATEVVWINKPKIEERGMTGQFKS
jgi:hypothetical protein